jgi:hypothetical protein
MCGTAQSYKVVRVRGQKRTAIRFALMAAIKEHEEKLNTERTLIRIATTMPIVGFECAFGSSQL